ncbi:MAG: hypothetical protein Q9180_005129 [Flavoplaca navasiana]
MRRGGIQAQAYLPPETAGVASTSLAMDLGHTAKTMAAGMTQAYIGDGKKYSSYDKRILAAAADRDKFDDSPGAVRFDPAPMPAAPTKRVQTAPAVITAACVEKGLDPSDTNVRQKMSRLLRKNNVRPASDTTASGTPVTREKNNDDAAKKGKEIEKDAGFLPLKRKRPLREQTESERNIDPVLLSGSVAGDGADQMEEHGNNGASTSESDEETPEQAAADCKELQNVLYGLGANDRLVNALVDEAADDWRSHAEEALPAKMADFVDFLASINVVRAFGKIKRKGQDPMQGSSKGNSRDDPTHFSIECANAAKGCTVVSLGIFAAREHAIKCPANKPDWDFQLQKKNQTSGARKFFCDEPGCGKAFAYKHRLATHKQNVHEKLKKPCSDPACDPNVLYSQHGMVVHREKAHNGFPKPCEIDGCSKILTGARSLSHHMKTSHKDVKKQSVQAASNNNDTKGSIDKSLLMRDTKCPVAGCLDPKTYTDTLSMGRHLNTCHGKTIRDKDMVAAIFTPVACSLDDCIGKHLFTTPDHFVAHVVNRHNADLATARLHWAKSQGA